MKIFALFAIGIGLLWAASAIGSFYFLDTWEIRGQFGDLFGSVNALFTGLAFAGLLYTVYLQRQELSLQRTELQLQREEMAASRRELAKQARQQRSQLLASIAELHIRTKQAEIAAVEMESLALIEHARADRSAPIIRRIVGSMLQVIDTLAEQIEHVDAAAAD